MARVRARQVENFFTSTFFTVQQEVAGVDPGVKRFSCIFIFLFFCFHEEFAVVV